MAKGGPEGGGGCVRKHGGHREDRGTRGMQGRGRGKVGGGQGRERGKEGEGQGSERGKESKEGGGRKE